MSDLIPTCHNCRSTEALEERHGLLICRGCWTIGGLLDDEEGDA
jgi:hypothetical protein